jgi:hypothetical protein
VPPSWRAERTRAAVATIRGSLFARLQTAIVRKETRLPVKNKNTREKTIRIAARSGSSAHLRWSSLRPAEGGQLYFSIHLFLLSDRLGKEEKGIESSVRLRRPPPHRSRIGHRLFYPFTFLLLRPTKLFTSEGGIRPPKLFTSEGGIRPPRIS